MESPNVGTYRVGHEAFNQRDFVAMTKQYADNITWTDHSQGRTFRTSWEFRDDFLAGWVGASPDIRITGVQVTGPPNAQYLELRYLTALLCISWPTSPTGPLLDRRATMPVGETPFCSWASKIVDHGGADRELQPPS